MRLREIWKQFEFYEKKKSERKLIKMNEVMQWSLEEEVLVTSLVIIYVVITT